MKRERELARGVASQDRAARGYRERARAPALGARRHGAERSDTTGSGRRDIKRSPTTLGSGTGSPRREISSRCGSPRRDLRAAPSPVHVHLAPHPEFARRDRRPARPRTPRRAPAGGRRGSRSRRGEDPSRAGRGRSNARSGARTRSPKPAASITAARRPVRLVPGDPPPRGRRAPHVGDRRVPRVGAPSPRPAHPSGGAAPAKPIQVWSANTVSNRRPAQRSSSTTSPGASARVAARRAARSAGWRVGAERRRSGGCRRPAPGLRRRDHPRLQRRLGQTGPALAHRPRQLARATSASTSAASR